MRWFENARDYMQLSPIELAYALMTRSGRVDDEDLRRRDPEFIAAIRASGGRRQDAPGDHYVPTDSAACRLCSSIPARVNRRRPSSTAEIPGSSKFNTIPQLASNRPVRLVESFAVVCVCAAPHLIASPEFHFQKPIGIGERLPRQSDNVSLALSQNRFGLFERRYSACCHHRRRKPRFVHRLLDCRNERDAASEGPSRIRKHSRHALISALTGVWINGLAHLRLLRVFKLAALRERQKIETGASKLDAEIDRIVNPIAARNYLISQESARRPRSRCPRVRAPREKPRAANARDFPAAPPYPSSRLFSALRKPAIV